MNRPAPQAAALAAFERAFADTDGVRCVQAPGRVNLIGEHTDYNDGFVLPCAIDRGTVVVARRRDDRQVRVVAADWDDAFDSFTLDAAIERRADAPWADYVRGSVAHLQAHGYTLCGAELAIAGNVPQGAGLSSSAALEVAVIQAFKTLLGLAPLDATRMAQIAQEAENRFVGCACGIMDQLVSAAGIAGHALLIDCRSLQTTPVPWPAGMALLVVDTGIRRGLVDSAYNLRRRQCETAARHFDVPALRDVSAAMFERGAAGLDPLTRARARHVVTENQRTLDAAAAMRSGDMQRLGRLMAQSHASMRDDFEITLPPIDALVDVLQAVAGDAGGARMTGGGFGGCVVALLPEPLIDAARTAVDERYRSPSGERAALHCCRPAQGAGEVG